MTETLPHGYSFVSTQQEFSNEYQHGRVSKTFVFFTLEESSRSIRRVNHSNDEDAKYMKII